MAKSRKTADSAATKADTTARKAPISPVTPAELDFGYDFIATFGDRPGLEETKATVFSQARKAISDSLADSAANEQLGMAALVYSYASLCSAPGYATLNYDQSRRIREVVQDVRKYTIDKSLQRPLNFLLLASPGSGKSQLVKSIAKGLDGSPIGLISFNMATMESKDDLLRVLDSARNLVVDGKLPLIFLDEFDSNESHYSLLLPLLWDGELDLTNRDLRIGRSIFFLAGSRSSLPDRLEEARDISGAKSSTDDDKKLVDLFSRINGGVVKVPSLGGEDTSADKVVIAMHLLRYRFRQCKKVPRSLLAFIAKAKLRYEARSIATLINLIDVPNAVGVQALTRKHLAQLPIQNPKRLKEGPLAFHLVNDEGPRGLTDLWKETTALQGDQLIRDDDLENAGDLGTAQWAQFAAAILNGLPTTI